MAKKFMLKPVTAALGATFAVSLSGGQVAHATENPFSMTELESGYMVTGAGDHEGKCGEGKCGEGEGKSEGEGKCGEGKCGEGEGKREGEGKGGEEAHYISNTKQDSEEYGQTCLHSENRH